MSSAIPEDERVLCKASRAVARILLLTAIGMTAAGAGEPSHPCAAVEDPAARLACYDNAFPRPPAAAAPQQAAEAPPHAAAPHPERSGPEIPGVAPAEAPELVETFGLTEAQLQARDPERARAPRVERIEATVVGIRHLSSGERVVTLDNGQVWLQTEITVRGHLAAGDEVVIRRAALGSFQLVTPGRVALRVRRIE
jgi:hypothetical protein